MKKRVQALQNPNVILNMPGYLYLNDLLLRQVREATGDEGRGTVDELKLSPLYDKMSDLLFPWCSTLTSRARYFYFSYAAIKLALERTVGANSINSNSDRKEVRSEASKKRSEFQRHIKRLEKHLALSLVLKERGLGVFGKIKAERWLRENRADVGAKQHTSILSLDGRYPNAIYRASCRKLGLFKGSSQTIDLISSRICGQNPFTLEWENAGISACQELERLDDFWQSNSSRDIGDVATEFEESNAFKRFNGFSMSERETELLFERIKITTPYWGKVSARELKKLFSHDVDFTDLMNVFKETDEVRYFEAAEHIDCVTKFFREHYSDICKNPKINPSITSIKNNLKLIKSSKVWLDQNSSTPSKNDTWESVWSAFYSSLIGNWISLTSAKSDAADKLARALKARAEGVVSDRGRGKVAPHKRYANGKPISEDDIQKELDLVPTSFRLRNAKLILKDVSEGFKHV